METGSVKTDGSTLSRFDQKLHHIERFLNLVAGVVILALMLIAVGQIFGRKLFNAPLPGFIDWVEQFMAVFALLGIAYTQRIGGHIRMDILVGQFRGRLLWISEIIGIILMIIVIAALTYGSFFHFLRAFQNGDSSIDIALPLWPAKLLVPIAFFILLLRLILQLWGYARAFRYNLKEPIAVPLIQDVATQAKQEAATVGERERNGSQ